MRNQKVIFIQPKQRNKDVPKKEVAYRLTKWNTVVGIVGGVMSVLLTIIIFWFTQNTDTKIEGMNNLLTKQDTLNDRQQLINAHLDTIQSSSQVSLQRAYIQLENQQTEISQLDKIATGQNLQIFRLIELVKNMRRQNLLTQTQIFKARQDSVNSYKLDSNKIKLVVFDMMNSLAQGAMLFREDSLISLSNFELRLLENVKACYMVLKEPYEKNLILLPRTKFSRFWEETIEILFYMELDLFGEIDNLISNDEFKPDLTLRRKYYTEFTSLLLEFTEFSAPFFKSKQWDIDTFHYKFSYYDDHPDRKPK